jgi:hypothetical protein
MWPLEVFPEVFVATATATPLSKLDIGDERSKGSGTTDRGPGPDYVAYVLVFLGIFSICRL